MPRPNIRRPQQKASWPYARTFRTNAATKHPKRRKQPKGYAGGVKMFHP